MKICSPCRFRSSHQRCSMEKGVLINFTKFTEKHPCKSLFFNKVAGLRPATLLKKSLLHRCFPVNFANFLRTPFLQNTSGRLLLPFNIEIFSTFTFYLGRNIDFWIFFTSWYLRTAWAEKNSTSLLRGFHFRTFILNYRMPRDDVGKMFLFTKWGINK